MPRLQIRFSALPPITNDGWVLTWNNSTTLPEWRVASGGGGGLAHITETYNNSTAPYSTDNAGEQLLASGTDANIDVALSPLGTGALEAQIADGTITGGNKRGANAVDWQTATRDAITQVASGTNAAIGGGGRNTASGGFATVGGGNINTASNTDAAVGGGGANTASGAESTVSGGNGNQATGAGAFVGERWVATGRHSPAMRPVEMLLLLEAAFIILQTVATQPLQEGLTTLQVQVPLLVAEVEILRHLHPSLEEATEMLLQIMMQFREVWGSP